MSQEDDAKITEYFLWITEHMLKPIENGCICGSCIAALLMMFAVIDSLGKLICEDKIVCKIGERFKWFLGKLGPGYKKHADSIWRMRNGFVHTTMAARIDITGHAERRNDHLAEFRTGFLLIHTGFFQDDLESAVTKAEGLVAENGPFRTRAMKRLKDARFTCVGDVSQEDVSTVTPAPDVEL